MNPSGAVENPPQAEVPASSSQSSANPLPGGATVIQATTNADGNGVGVSTVPIPESLLPKTTFSADPLQPDQPRRRLYKGRR